MGTLIVNKTALIIKAIDARLDMLLREDIQAHDVIVTPIAGAWMGNNLPWYGSLYCKVLTSNEVEPEHRRAAVQVSEFGHFQVLFGDQDNLRFPGGLNPGDQKLVDFEDKCEAADVILNYLITGYRETPYKREKDHL